MPYTPQQNGVAEGMNRTLNSMALAQPAHAGLPKTFWAEAVNCVAYIRERLPTECHGVTPYEWWHNRKLKLAHVRVFGCVAFILKPTEQQKQMEVKAEMMHFISYASGACGYRFWNDEKHCIFIRRDAQFNEHQLSLTAKSSISDPENPISGRCESRKSGR